MIGKQNYLGKRLKPGIV